MKANLHFQKWSQAKLSGYPDFEHVVNGAGIQLQDRLSIFEIGIWQSVFGGDRGVLSPRCGDKASQQLTSLKTKQYSSFTHASKSVKRRLKRHRSARQFRLCHRTDAVYYSTPKPSPPNQQHHHAPHKAIMSVTLPKLALAIGHLEVNIAYNEVEATYPGALDEPWSDDMSGPYKHVGRLFDAMSFTTED